MVMAKYLVDESTMTNIANTIREITGSNSPINGNNLSVSLTTAVSNKIDPPSGTLNIITNAEEIDVTNIATVNVRVPLSTGWIIDVDANGAPISGHFVPTTGKTTAGKVLNYGNNATSKGVLQITIDEGTTTIANNAFEYTGITQLIYPSTIQKYGDYAARNCADLTYVEYKGDCIFNYYDYMNTAVTTIVCKGNVTKITGLRVFPATTELLDFSHCTAVPLLNYVNAFQDVVSCIIKVPQSLLSDWQTATNWCDLTNVTFQGV